MQNHLTDLDELLENVRDSRSRDYISEAIRTYRAGAYRSAIIATWVAVCIDLIDKIRKLRNEGHQYAKILEEKLDDLHHDNMNGFMKYENELLINALEKLEVISSQEFKLLQRIKEDRNFCAHPNFKDDGQREQISAENARAHIVNACNALLLHLPIKGKISIEKIQQLVAETSFPTDAEKAYDVLSSEYYLKRAQDFVLHDITINFLNQIFQNDEMYHWNIDRISSALQAISKLNTDIYINTLEETLNSLLSGVPDAKLRRIFLLPHLWFYIDNAIQQIIIGLIPSLSAGDIINYRLYNFSELVPEIKPDLEQIYAVLNDADKLKVIAGSPIKKFRALAIETFLNSDTYDNAYANGSNFLLPHAQYFNAEDLKKILSGVNENNQILPARGIQEIFIGLFNKTQGIPEYKEIWSEFWDSRNNFPVLLKLLAENDIIPAQTQNADDGQDMDLA